MTEHWRTIPGRVYYEVSDRGRVRSWCVKGSRRRADQPAILRQTKNANGYWTVKLFGGEPGKTRLVHQLVLEVFVGPRGDGLEVRHLDGTRTNNQLTNLAYGTHSENQQDSVRHGTFHSPKRGVAHCPKGHAYDDENTYRRPPTGREGRNCRECGREAVRRYRARKRASLRIAA